MPRSHCSSGRAHPSSQTGRVPSSTGSADGAAAEGLTPTEARVADLLAGGLSNKEIATTLVVSVSAVEAHLTRIYAKLGLRSRAQLARGGCNPDTGLTTPPKVWGIPHYRPPRERRTLERVSHFLAERYLAGQDGASLAREADRINTAITGRGGVQLVTALYVPDDEVCFFLFESDSADLGGHAHEFDRVVPVVAI